MINKFLLIVIAVLAVGCGTTANTRVPIETRVQERFPDRPPAYRDGYVDGCKTGIAKTKNSGTAETRDLTRFQSDQIYASGWYDGIEACRDNYEAPSPDERRHDDTKPVRTEGGW